MIEDEERENMAPYDYPTNLDNIPAVYILVPVYLLILLTIVYQYY